MSAYRRIAAVTIAAAAVLGLSACGGDDPLEPAAKGEETASSTPTPAKAADVTLEVPEGAKAKTADGGIEFTKFYFDQVNAAFRTGDYLPLVKITTSSCIVCRQTIGDIAFAYARGSIKGGEFSLRDFKSGKQEGDLQSLQFKYDEAKYTEIDEGGSQIWESEAKKDIGAVVRLKWVDGGWAMDQLAPISQGVSSR